MHLGGEGKKKKKGRKKALLVFFLKTSLKVMKASFVPCASCAYSGIVQAYTCTMLQ